MMTPSEISSKLKIQPSTLRKYSALLEQEGIHFQRNHKNGRLYTDSEYIALKNIIAMVKSNKKSLEEAVAEASVTLKNNEIIAPQKRNSDDIATATLEEIKQLRIQLEQQEERQKERDVMFVEVLEKMQEKIDRLEDQEKRLLAAPSEKSELEATELLLPEEEERDPVVVKKDPRNLWARIWNK